MAQIYDSEKVRAAAVQVKKLSDGLKEGTDPNIRGARINAEALRGRAAEALNERIGAFDQEMRSICASLTDVAQALEQYAAVLESVDDKLKAEM